MVLDCRQAVPDCLAIRESLCPAEHPESKLHWVYSVEHTPRENSNNPCFSSRIHFTIFHLPVLTTVLDYRQAIPDYPAICESMCLAGYPETHAPLVPQHKQDQPTTLLSRDLGPRPNLDSKPPHLSPELSVVLRSPPSTPLISRSEKSQN